MTKRWVVGGIWAILMAAGGLMCGRNAAADPRPNMVQKVTFLGAKHVKSDELQDITGVQTGMPLDPDRNLEGCQKIIAKYQEIGRPYTSCSLVKGGDLSATEVVYQINEGPKTKVRKIKFVGNSFVSGVWLATQIKSSKHGVRLIGDTYNKQMAEAEVKELYKFYRGFGYQDVRIALETQRSEDGSEVTLIFHIHEGPRSRVHDARDIPGTGNVLEAKTAGQD